MTVRTTDAAAEQRTYENAAMIAEALPDHLREAFAALLLDLEPATPYVDPRHAGVRRWAADAGFVDPRRFFDGSTVDEVLACPCVDPDCPRRYDNHVAHPGRTVTR